MSGFLLLAADLSPLGNERYKKDPTELICPFNNCKCTPNCPLFKVYTWKIALGRRPWRGCALAALPLVLKGEL